MSEPELTADELRHLERCLELAGEALEAGHAPFGSVLVSGAGVALAEDHNRIGDGDPTAHPEIALARWAAAHLTAEERATATVFTSGEHCAMCAAAHAWVGLGRIVYATSTAQLLRWRAEDGVAAGPVQPLPIGTVAPGSQVQGPVAQFTAPMRALHARHARP